MQVNDSTHSRSASTLNSANSTCKLHRPLNRKPTNQSQITIKTRNIKTITPEKKYSLHITATMGNVGLCDYLIIMIMLWHTTSHGFDLFLYFKPYFKLWPKDSRINHKMWHIEKLWITRLFTKNSFRSSNYICNSKTLSSLYQKAEV